MLKSLMDQLLVFLGLVGISIAAGIGSAARQVYHPDGFDFTRALRDGPFAVVVGLIVGAIGSLVGFPDIVNYGLAAAIGYLGPQWLDGWLRKRAEEKLAKGRSDESGAM